MEDVAMDESLMAASSLSEDAFEKPTFINGKYGNPKSFLGWTGLPGLQLVWRYKRNKDLSNIPSSEQELNKALPLVEPKFNPDAQLEATWIGHATVVVTLDGATFITDPIWSNHCSPIMFFGPKRYRPPPCKITDLKKVDFVVISHNHYDHLDRSSVHQLEQQFGGGKDGLRWFVPMGLKGWMEKNGCRQVEELTWGEKKSITINSKQFDVHCVPAQHWSTRTGFDRFKSLWSGWAVVGPQHRFYFTGDTGFCKEEFVKIGRRLGPFDLAAIPLGCYEPKWFMSPQHIGPEEAVEIHKLVRAKKSIGVHWGTFHMGSHEPYMEPKLLLEEAVKKAGLDKEAFITVHHGETRNYSNSKSEEQFHK
uniref:Metallo-beta-lactamase domain-containing protein n=1 Tax=Plectus sambesii TaxID=2011161 RepID=A0A914XK84_9BILA